MMNILTISGSTRLASSNSQLLRALAEFASDDVKFLECQKVQRLPIFNQDDEKEKTPNIVLEFCEEIATASGIVVSSPEYVHSIPGGLKNAIDWLVSRNEIIHKPIALAHASHRGDEMLESLRRVLSTVSDNFSEEIFLRIPIVSKSPQEIDEILSTPENTLLICEYVSRFINYIEGVQVHE